MKIAREFAIVLPLIAFAPIGSASDLKDRLVTALEIVGHSCGDDVKTFCGKVSDGEGRVLLCMQAHEDQLSVRCNIALYRASRRLDAALHKVERLAHACWADIEAQCGSSERVGQCLMQKRSSLSPACQSTFQAVKDTLRGLVSLRGMTVYSDDDKDLGRVVNVRRGSDNKVHSIDIEIGRFLGIGNKVVTIDADKLQEVAGKVRLHVRSDQFRALPDASGK